MATTTYATGEHLPPGEVDSDRVQSPALKRVSWSAILAGVVVTLSLQLLLSTLGVGIGLGAIEPATGNTPDAASFGMGAGIWWLVSTLISLAAGGYAAAWLAGITLRFDGMLHGLVTWGATLLLTFYLLSSAVGSAVGGAFNLIGNVTGTVASTAGEGIRAAAPQIAEMAPSMSPEQLRERARDFLRPTNADPATLSPEDAQTEIASNLSRVMAGGEQAEQARQRIVAIMAAQLQIPPEEAQRRFDEAQAQAQAALDQARATATQATDEAAATASTGSFMAFAALLLGAAAAAIGGAFAVQRRAYVVM